jgi:hypothetical protein
MLRIKKINYYKLKTTLTNQLEFISKHKINSSLLGRLGGAKNYG